MKLFKILFFTAGLLPSYVVAWNSPGEPFSGQLKFAGEVKSTKNPWLWKLGGGKNDLIIKTSKDAARNKKNNIQLTLPEMTILLGKTSFATPAGREGLAPRVTYGSGEKGFSLKWTDQGVAELTLPVKGDNGTNVGSLNFKMRAMAVLRHSFAGRENYINLYDNSNGNGLPDRSHLLDSLNVSGHLEKFFNGEGPQWLKRINITETSNIIRFNDSSLHQVEGVYGAQIVPNSGELSLRGQELSNWHVSLPVNIEYH
ncbi:fimbrial protein [Enterobacter ludwigii]|uniref:F4 family fimbrial subunit n=1 Tax=Enterobacter ludwigii TaxID=299767 RepID=UPI002FFBC6E2